MRVIFLLRYNTSCVRLTREGCQLHLEQLTPARSHKGFSLAAGPRHTHYLS